jgi:hypothetical protein
MTNATRTITKAALFCAALGALLAVAPAARAEAETHDGFFFQVNTGLSYLSATAEYGGQEASFSGISTPFQLGLGGTVGPVVIGGGFFFDRAASPSGEYGGLDQDDVTMTLIGIGMFADIYPDPKSGLHFQPWFGWGGLEFSYQGDVGGSDPTGMVLALGVGYDFFVSDNWSIGPMLRMAYAPLAMGDVDWTTTAPALVCNFTYH